MTRIKEARLALGITAVEAARRIGISRQRYSQYERGLYEANYEMLLRIGEAFGVSVDWLLNRDNAPADVLRSVIVGRVMSLSDDQIQALADALDHLGPPAKEESRKSPESECGGDVHVRSAKFKAR